VSWGENYAGSSGLASPKLFSPMHFVRDTGSTAPVCNNVVTFATFAVTAIIVPSLFISLM